MNSLLTDSLLLPHSESFSDGDIEHAPLVPTHSSEFGMKGFFEEVQEIDKQIEKLSKLLTKLQDAHEESKAVTKASAMKEIKHRMGKDIDEVLKIARITKTKLEKLDKNNLANRQKIGCAKGSAVDRSRTATTISLKKKLKERLTDFQSLRETINQEYWEVVERRVFTVTGNRPDEETIDRLIETGNDEQIFEKAIQEQGRSEVTDTLAEIQERHDAVRDLERKLLELQQIFFDLAVLVASQGEILDNVESQVSTALDHIHSGTSALQKVKWVQKNSSKWICVAVIIVVIIVVVIVVGVLKPWNKKGS